MPAGPLAGLGTGEQQVEGGLDVALRGRVVRLGPALEEATALPVGGHHEEALPRELADVGAVRVLVAAARVHVEDGRERALARGDGDLDGHVHRARLHARALDADLRGGHGRRESKGECDSAPRTVHPEVPDQKKTPAPQGAERLSKPNSYACRLRRIETIAPRARRVERMIRPHSDSVGMLETPARMLPGPLMVTEKAALSCATESSNTTTK